MKISRSFLIPIALLGLLHLYIGLRLLPDLAMGSTGIAVGIIVLIASCALVPLSMTTRSIKQPSADRIAWIGFTMMSGFSSLFVLTLLRDVFLLGALIVGPQDLTQLRHISAVVAAAFAAVITLVGLVSARRRARIVNVDVPIADLPRSLHGFSIAQISDVHVGSTIKRPYVDTIVDAVNELQADVIAVTGDLVDGSVRELAAHVAPLSRLRARHGTYFVTGNHEYYSGERQWTRELQRLGMKVLMNEHVALREGDTTLVLAGVADYNAHHFNPEQRSDPALALAGAPRSDAKVLLAHQPRTAASAEAAGFDLQLSGHTHGGQFWPWNHFVRLQQPYTAGLHRLNKLWIYISRGTGYWGPPNRFGAPSEITHLRLVRA